MAATLANKGEPVTGRSIFGRHYQAGTGGHDDPRYVRAAGNWMIDIGLPAKSGVDGGIMVVVPGQLGIGSIPHRLTARQLLRGAAAIRRVTRDLACIMPMPHHLAAQPCALTIHWPMRPGCRTLHRTVTITSQFGERCQILRFRRSRLC